MDPYLDALDEVTEAGTALVEIGETDPDSAEFALARKRQLAAGTGRAGAGIETRQDRSLAAVAGFWGGRGFFGGMSPK